MTRPQRAFTLVEMLVALAIFAAIAAAAWGGLAQIARTRARLGAEQQRFADVVRSVSTLARDLGAATPRPVRGNDGAVLPALVGTGDHIAFTAIGAADPRVEARSQLERILYSGDDRGVQRAIYAALDRAPGSTPLARTLLSGVEHFALRYHACDGRWYPTWPPPAVPACAPQGLSLFDVLPDAVEFTIDASGIGSIRRVVELASSWPLRAADAGPPAPPPPPPARDATP